MLNVRVASKSHVISQHDNEVVNLYQISMQEDTD